MKQLPVFIIGFLISTNLYAQIRIDDSFASSTLENQMSIFRDSTNTLTIDSILKNKPILPFIISKTPSPSFGYDSSHFWANFQVKNVTPQNIMFFLRIYRTSLDIANFYLCYKGKVVAKESFDWKTPFYQRKNSSKLVSAQFQIDSQKVYDVYILVARKGRIIGLPVHILSSKAFYEREKYEDLFYGILMGGTFLCVLMGFFLFILSRELLYLYYSLYAICSTMTALGIGGVLMQPFGYKIRILTGPENYYFFILGLFAFNILFTHLFFGINKKGPKWLYSLGKVTVVFCMVCAIAIIYDYRIIDKINFLYLYILFIPILISSIIIALLRREVVGKFYVIAFIPLITVAFLIIISEIGFIKSDILLPYAAPSLLFEIAVLLVGLAFRLYDFQLQKQKLESEMIFQIIHSQETERNRIAQDLHDEVGNSLAALKNYISQTNLELGEKINNIAQDVRNISHNLASIEFDKTTLSIAFQNLINRHNDAEDINYELIEVGATQKLPAEKELVIYRIVCELLNNIQKHSKAQKAILQLIYVANMLTVIVEDDGIGIKNKLTIEEGIGLKHIQTRVAYLNAKLTIDDDGKGTIIVIDVPI